VAVIGPTGGPDRAVVGHRGGCAAIAAAQIGGRRGAMGDRREDRETVAADPSRRRTLGTRARPPQSSREST
jgi:hypothetical protein